MSRVRRALRTVAMVLAAALVLAGGGFLGSSSPSAQAKVGKPRGSAASGKGDPAVTRRLALQAGLQVAPKHRNRPTVTMHGRTYAAANPYLAELPAGTRVDWSYWRRQLTHQGQRRVALKNGPHPAVAVPTPYAFHEAEPAGVHGRNDVQADAERLTKLGVDNQFKAAKVHGRLSVPSVSTDRWHTREDQGSIPLAQRTGIGFHRDGVKVTSRIGDGPHGRARDGHGDFDFFRVHVAAGDTIRATTAGSNFDTVLVVYNRHGQIVAANDDTDDESITSTVTYRSATADYYYVMVGGFSFSGSVPARPFHSGSGSGAGEQGKYHLAITGSPVDEDQYAVKLASGDVLGGVLTGAAKTVQVHRVGTGATAVGSQQDASSAYPPQSPLPGGGATFAYVAEEPGWYTVSASEGKGVYQLLLETYPAGALRAASGETQTLFLDFDGERLNTGMFGGNGVSTLSPLRRFLPKWGLRPGDESALIDQVVASVKENIVQTLQAKGLNHHLVVNVLNSRDDPDHFGRSNVSRVVVGGTINQTGVPTIGISQSIDPGNFSHGETAMVLLDEVSLPKGAEDSFNTYMRPRSNRIAFVGRALGNLVAHETGHMIGSFHTDSLDSHVNLMDSGGNRFGRFFGIGPDGIGGTGDDTDVDFGKDRLDPDEGFAGVEDTLNTSAWAFLVGTRQ